MKRTIVDIAAQRQLIAAKSQEMQNTVTSTPPWLIRYGLSAFFITLIFIAGFGMMLRFPERIPAPASVITGNGGPGIFIWIKEEDTALIRPGQQATIRLKNRTNEQSLEIKARTGPTNYSSQAKKFFVQALPKEGTDLQALNSNLQGEAQITYNRRSLLEQVLDAKK